MANERRERTVVQVVPAKDKSHTYPVAATNVSPVSGHSSIRIWWTKVLAQREQGRTIAYRELVDEQVKLGHSLVELREVADELENIDTVLEGNQAERRAAKRLKEASETRAEIEAERARIELENLKRSGAAREEDEVAAEMRRKREQLAMQIEIAELEARLKKARGEDNAERAHPAAKQFRSLMEKEDQILAQLRGRIVELIERRGGPDKLKPEDATKIKEWEDVAQTLTRT